ncbi:MAG: hypothetical protein M9943_12145 [Burkholderiaceae bacterium]|nr:hypothetical protein [Burkholderiaceae bacterium]
MDVSSVPLAPAAPQPPKLLSNCASVSGCCKFELIFRGRFALIFKPFRKSCLDMHDGIFDNIKQGFVVPFQFRR